MQLAISETGGQRRFHFTAEASVSAESDVGELHLFVGRKWVDDASGEAIDLAGDAFDQMIRNFRASESKRVSVDYDHKSWNRANPDSRAAGWIVDLFTRDGASGFRELWARVEWTKKAADAIRAREFCFCSPSFDLEGVSTKTGNGIGARLMNAALTNVPFQDGLTPIHLSLVAPENTMPAADKTEIKQMAAEPPVPPPAPDKPAAKDEKKPDDKPADDGMGQLNALVDLVAEAAAIDRMAAIAAMADKVEEIGALIRKTVDKDGMPAEKMASGAEPITPAAPAPAAAPVVPAAAPVQMSATAPDLDAIERRTLARQLEESRAEIAALKGASVTAAADEATAAQNAIETEATAMVNEGYALDSERPDLVHMLSADRPRALRIWSQKRVPIAAVQSTPTTDPDSGAAKPPSSVAAPITMTAHGDERDLVQFSEAQRSAYRGFMQMNRGQRIWSEPEAHRRAVARISKMKDSELGAKPN